MIVVDASAWVDYLRLALPEAASELIGVEGCFSPPHVDFEVGSGLLRLERRGRLPAGAARELIGDFSRSPLERIWQPIDATEAVDLLNNASYADAWYLALARRLGCSLMTSDADMKTAASMHGVRVIDATQAS